MCMLQGVSMLQVEAMPTTGFWKSASWKPTARNIERLGARSGPSWTWAEWGRSEGVEAVFLAMVRAVVADGSGAGRGWGISKTNALPASPP